MNFKQSYVTLEVWRTFYSTWIQPKKSRSKAFWRYVKTTSINMETFRLWLIYHTNFTSWKDTTSSIDSFCSSPITPSKCKDLITMPGMGNRHWKSWWWKVVKSMSVTSILSTSPNRKYLSMTLKDKALVFARSVLKKCYQMRIFCPVENVSTEDILTICWNGLKNRKTVLT